MISGLGYDVCYTALSLTFAHVLNVDNKQRLKGFNPVQRSIPCAALNAQGTLFAYASSYDWSKGSQYHAPGSPNEIYIHYTPENEIKPKAKR